jgi:glycosyltransferase involved in cell wall biosynthesis
VAAWAWDVATLLHERGLEVQVHARRAARAPFVVRTMRGRSWQRWQHVWAGLSMRPRIREGDGVICATWPMAAWLGAHRPLVAFHGSELTRASAIPGLERVKSSAGALLPVSRYLGVLLGAPHRVLPWPIDPKPRAQPGDALLCVARLVPGKGVDRVLSLGARLGRPVTIVGDGPERPALEKQAYQLGVRATFRGAVPRDAVPWDGAWACALLSRARPDGSGAEGLGLALLEAGARGIPTLGARVGGIPEAASVVLDDPERDDIPALPSPDEVRDRLAAHHGRARTMAVLSPLLAPTSSPRP